MLNVLVRAVKQRLHTGKAQEQEKVNLTSEKKTSGLDYHSKSISGVAIDKKDDPVTST